jgi:outer membrane murein-binding lipoprotein Lpp
MRTIKLILAVLMAALLLAGCVPIAAQTPTPTDDASEALLDQVETLGGKIEQLQSKIEMLEKENELMQDDATACAVDDLNYLLDLISASGQTLVSFPAMITGMDATDDGFVLHITRQTVNPSYEPGAPDGETYLIDDGNEPECVLADRFTFVHYGGYLLPELDLSFGDYIAGSDGGVPFTIYMLSDQAIYLDEFLVP